MEMSKLFNLTCMFTKAGLTGISGGATTFSTGSATLSYAIAGIMYSNAQVSGGTTPVVGAVSGAAITLADEQARTVVWVLDSSGNEKVIEGEVVDLDGDGNYVNAPPLPNIDLETYCPFAYQVIKASGLTGTFTFGSSNWNTTGMTHTVKDVATLPSRPPAP